jgi:hypothetical protein
MGYNLFLDDFRVPYNENSFFKLDAYNLIGDERYKNLDWIIVKNFGEFIKTIEEKGLPELISTDHDLQDFHYYHYSKYITFTGKIDYEVVEGTGYECIKWLIQYIDNNNLKMPEILIHTQNPIGAENIKNLINNYKNKKL